LGFVKYGEFPD